MAGAPRSGGKKTPKKTSQKTPPSRPSRPSGKAARKTATAAGKAVAQGAKKTVTRTVAKKPVVTKKTVVAKKPAVTKKKAVAKKPVVIKKPLHPVVAAKTLEKLKARLEEERETYLRQADDLAAEAEALMADREQGDTQFDEESGEGDTINVERERDLALSASARQSVEEIDEALARIKAGTYGICLRCGNRIPIARLEAVPQASLCIECKSRQERRR